MKSLCTFYKAEENIYWSCTQILMYMLTYSHVNTYLLIIQTLYIFRPGYYTLRNGCKIVKDVLNANPNSSVWHARGHEWICCNYKRCVYCMWGSMNISDSGKSCFNSGRVNLFSNGSLQILTFDLKQQLRNPHCDN